MVKYLMVVCALAGLFTFGAVPAMSDSDNSAVMIKDFGCGVLNGNGNVEFAEGRISVKTHGGTTTLVCKAKGVLNDSGKAVVWNYDNTGFMCGTAGGPTAYWQNTVSASGNATLVCHVRND